MNLTIGTLTQTPYQNTGVRNVGKKSDMLELLIFLIGISFTTPKAVILITISKSLRKPKREGKKDTVESFSVR